MSTRDIYKHIYGKCQQSLLFRTRAPDRDTLCPLKKDWCKS
jgi:hypothetical protein